LAPFSKVIYVLDVSGSMRGELAEAIRTIDVFMTDDFGAAAVTFNAEHARWKGVENHHGHDATAPCNNRCSPAGWCRMPEHRLELLAHLNSFIGDGDTQPASAVAYAIRNAPAECLIVFISDGGFVGAPVVDAAKAGIAWRKEQEMAPVQLLVWSTKKDADKQTSLVDLAKIGGGGLWRAKPPEDQETPPGDPR
jgi:Mg-chelatase subunit ChlD